MSDAGAIDFQKLRIDGIYQQDKKGNLMLRVKVPAGVISGVQAKRVAAISERFSNGMLHLTSRGSIELHWVQYPDLPAVSSELAAVGLTSRGACGGAVRGISCSTGLSEGFGEVQVLARKLQRHFAGNPHFEGLPKKFKIAVEGGYEGSRHLIQDLGLVYLGTEDGQRRYDVWTAGGLGRQPTEAFKLVEGVAENRVIPIAEAVVRVYKAHTPKPKRLKHLVQKIGQQRFRELVEAEPAFGKTLEIATPLDGALTAKGERVLVPVFAGELGAADMNRLADLADEHAGGYLSLTADQDVALFVAGASDGDALRKALDEAGFGGQQVAFRVCPGNHECCMGLSATRDVTRQLVEAMGAKGREAVWAISGCPNSCSQPQLGDYGIITSKLVSTGGGEKEPRFDLYRREGKAFGQAIRQGLSLEQLLAAVGEIG